MPCLYIALSLHCTTFTSWKVDNLLHKLYSLLPNDLRTLLHSLDFAAINFGANYLEYKY